jgi:tetratricopeptide (TPR) repeat protein
MKPNSNSAYKNRGYTKRLLGDFDGTISDYSIAIKLNPKDDEAYRGRENMIKDAVKFFQTPQIAAIR